MKIEFQLVRKKDNFYGDSKKIIKLLETSSNFKLDYENQKILFENEEITYDISDNKKNDTYFYGRKCWI